MAGRSGHSAGKPGTGASTSSALGTSTTPSASTTPSTPSLAAAEHPSGIDIQQSVAQGVMITSSSAVMTVKNRLIVMILRERAEVDADSVVSLVYEALGETIREQKTNAAYVRDRERAATRIRGRSEHEHDFTKRDVDILRDRHRVYLEVIHRLRQTRSDRGSLALLAELAIGRARDEIEHASRDRVDAQVPAVGQDPAYVAERAERLRRFAEIDLAGLLESGRAGTD